MKKNYRLITVILVCCITLIILADKVSALRTEVNLFYLNSSKSIVVSIEWDIDDVSFVIISPKGRTITKATQAADLAIVKLEKSIRILIRNAEEGQWKLDYDKGSNEYISVSVDEYEEGIWITDFEVEDPYNSILPVTFFVEHNNTLSYNYTISLVMSEGGPEKVIHTGRGTTNNEINLDVTLDSVNSHNKYILKLYATHNLGGYDYFDIAYSRPFSYNNPNTPVAISNFDIEIDIDNNTMTIDWGKYLPYFAEGCIVAVFENDSSDPVAFEVFDRSQSSYSMFYNSQNERVIIDLKMKVGLLYSDSMIKTIYPNKQSDNFYIVFEESDTININQYKIKHFNANNQLLRIMVNGREEAVILNGHGEKFINLVDDYNKVHFEYLDKDLISWVYHKNILVDKIPPRLQIFESIDGLKTKEDTFIITGYTEGDASLKINGIEVQTLSNGRFSHEIQLQDDANEVLVSSTDIAGNTSTYRGVIYRGRRDTSDAKQLRFSGLQLKDLGYLPLIITLCGTTLLSFLILLLWRVEQK